MESTSQNNNIKAIKEVRNLFNDVRNSLFNEEIKRIRKELYKKEAVYTFLKEKEHEGIITNKQKNVLKNIDRYFKKLNGDLRKLQKYQDNMTYALDYLFNEVNEENYYEPKVIRRAFDGNYILYESRGDNDNMLAIYEYFDKIKPYLNNMIDDYKTKGEWKIQLVMRVIFVSFIDKNETQVMHTKSHNVKIMNGTDTNEAINELIKSFTKRYQEGLETKMKGNSYIFECVDLLEYHLHKISLNRGSSYIDSPDWIKHKEVTINPQNTNGNKSFQYAIIAALNYQNIDNHSERISKLKRFIDNYNWDNVDFPAGHKDSSVVEKNNNDIVINIVYVPYKTKEIRQAYISKHNKTSNIHVHLLMITDGTGNWPYLAIISISGLLRGVTSKHNGDFYCLNCFQSYATEKKLRKHKKVCENHDFCNLKMPDEDNKILQYISGEKSLKVPFVIYADLECVLKKVNTCQNNPDKSYTKKKATHRPSGYSLSTCCSFDKSLNEQKYYRAEDCMKIFFKDLKDQAMKIINCEKKEMIP